MKRIMAVVLSIVMLLALSVPAFALEQATIKEAKETIAVPGEGTQGKVEDTFDGNYGSAYVFGWAGVLTTKREMTFELDKACTLETLSITWGHPNWSDWEMSARAYTVSVSADGEEFTDVLSEKDLDGLGVGKQRTDTYELEEKPENVKFVRLTVTEANTVYLALAEFVVNKDNGAVPTTDSSVTASEAETSSETTSSEETSSAAASSEATSSAVTSSAATSSEAVSSVGESSAAATDNEPKSMTWLWIVLAAVVVVVVVVIVLTSKKKK